MKNLGIGSSYSIEKKIETLKHTLTRLCICFNKVETFEVHKELERLLFTLDTDFLEQRSAFQLAKLLYCIAFLHQRFFRSAMFTSLDKIPNFRIFRSELSFTFGTKKVISILGHAYLKDCYEIFHEEHLMLMIQKIFPETEIVKNSLYFFQHPKTNLKTLYFEMYLKSGACFTSTQFLRLKKFLKDEAKHCIESTTPKLFILRNEEEILKNLAILKNQIQEIDDLPQIMISFERQSVKTATFNILCARPLNPSQSSLEHILRLLNQEKQLKSYLDRKETFRFSKNGSSIEICVFRLELNKDLSILTKDFSLNVYKARERICTFLKNIFGTFRDYNGGILEKQKENLLEFKTCFDLEHFQDIDLVETFFYSLTPFEAQAFLSKEVLFDLFTLLLKARQMSLSKASDFFFEIKEKENFTFFMIRVADDTIQPQIEALISSLALDEKIVSVSFNQDSEAFLGFILQKVSTTTTQYLYNLILEELNRWKLKTEGKKILNLCFEVPPISLDPRVGGDQVSAIVLKMLFEGLMRKNREGKLEQALAEKIELSPDRKTYLFYLKTTFWSDGSIVSAYDFEYAWKKVLSPSFETLFSYLFDPIKNAKLAKHGNCSLDEIGIKALDEFTLQVDLEFPTPYFLELLSHPIYSPVHREIDQLHPSWPFEEKSYYVCNGAFKLQKHRPYQEYLLVKNPLYWDFENIQLDKVYILKTTQEQSYGRFRQGLNHCVGIPMGLKSDILEPDPDQDTLFYKDVCVYWVSFNTQKFPFNHSKIRKALTLAIDRTAIKTQSNLSPAFSPLPPLHSQIGDQAFPSYSKEKAQQLFKEALDELDLEVTDIPCITLHYLPGSIGNFVMPLLKEGWETILGIKIVLCPFSWDFLKIELKKSQYHILGISWTSWIDDPIYVLNSFRDKYNLLNLSQWHHFGYQQILLEAENTEDLALRKQLYLEAEKILIEEMLIFPFCIIHPKILKKRNLTIYHPCMLIDFKWSAFNYIS